METRGIARGVTVIDDFAHHPTAIATTIAGLRRRVATKRILALLDPRSNTMRMGVMQQQLAPSLADADLVFCYGPRSGPQALRWDPRAAMAALGDRLQVFESIEELVGAVAAQARSGDFVLAMSNGSFGGVHEKLLQALQKGTSPAGGAS
jgi:UDP-N-acetylmuramate: L-alanyl-gamma-D-glutamyl-meso-diaminopimelate ligase